MSLTLTCHRKTLKLISTRIVGPTRESSHHWSSRGGGVKMTQMPYKSRTNYSTPVKVFKVESERKQPN